MYCDRLVASFRAKFGEHEIFITGNHASRYYGRIGWSCVGLQEDHPIAQAQKEPVRAAGDGPLGEEGGAANERRGRRR